MREVWRQMIRKDENGGNMLKTVVLEGENVPENYEKNILHRLSRCSSGLMPPFTILENQACLELIYDVSDLKTLKEYRPGRVKDAFRILRYMVFAFLSVQDRLLKPERFFTDPEMILTEVREDGCTGIRVLYGRGRSANGDDDEAPDYTLILPVLHFFTELTETVGMKDAFRETEEKIRDRDPGLKDMLSIIETIEREWNYILI
jgi:hypothetical protein